VPVPSNLTGFDAAICCFGLAAGLQEKVSQMVAESLCFATVCRMMHGNQHTRFFCVAGSTQEEVSQMVAESVREAQISGSDRPVAWDGSAVRTFHFLDARH